MDNKLARYSVRGGLVPSENGEVVLFKDVEERVRKAVDAAKQEADEKYALDLHLAIVEARKTLEKEKQKEAKA